MTIDHFFRSVVYCPVPVTPEERFPISNPTSPDHSKVPRPSLPHIFHDDIPTTDRYHKAADYKFSQLLSVYSAGNASFLEARKHV